MLYNLILTTQYVAVAETCLPFISELYCRVYDVYSYDYIEWIQYIITYCGSIFCVSLNSTIKSKWHHKLRRFNATVEKDRTAKF